MIGFLIAAPTLVAAARLDVAEAQAAGAGLPTAQPVDYFDLSDLLTQAAQPTMSLLTVTVNSDGSAAFELPRAEVGQGITTASAMVIADEMELPISKVHVTLADARPELVWNQLTGGSNSMHALYPRLREAAASAREQLAETAARELGVAVSDLRLRNGVFTAPDGRKLSYADLAEKAAVTDTIAVKPRLKAQSELKIVGKDQSRTDALAAVTGAKTFALDIKLANAICAMICRAPTINGSAKSIKNAAAVKAMPGVSGVVILEHNQFVQGGIAVTAKTFGQCIDAIRALQVEWNPGTVDDKSKADVLADLEANELPMTPAPPGEVVEELFTFNFRPGDPLETNCAVADMRADGGEVWAWVKSPIWTQEQIATSLGYGSFDAVKVHVTEGGGSFGRHLFSDAAFEAAWLSKQLGRPVRLMWHRTDNFRHGRVHPMSTSRVRIVHDGSQVMALDQRHTSVQCDFTHGIGELFTSMDVSLPQQNTLQFSQGVFMLTANVPYNFGPVSQMLFEIYDFNTFNTSAVRNVYSPDVVTARELAIDKTANAMKVDRVKFRQQFLRDERLLAVLNKVAAAGKWGRSLPAGIGQGIGLHREYKGAGACLIEIDCRPETVNRQVREAYTGPRVTKAVFAVDVGLPINPLGLRAQMMGGMMDGIAQALTYGLHLEKGHFAEGSWDDAYYTRQWNTPPEVQVIVMPPTSDSPGGAGELAVGTTMAAVASAVGAATGKIPTEFPINHNEPLHFEPFPYVPPVPQSPTDGLSKPMFSPPQPAPRHKRKKKKRKHKAHSKHARRAH